MKEIPEHLVADSGEGPAGRLGAIRGAGPEFDGPPSFGRSGTLTDGGVRTPVKSTGAEELGLAPGDKIVHARWGEGVIVSVIGEGDTPRR